MRALRTAVLAAAVSSLLITSAPPGAAAPARGRLHPSRHADRQPWRRFAGRATSDALQIPWSTTISSPRAAAGRGHSAGAGHLPGELFDFEESDDLVGHPGILVAFQAGSFPQPVDDERRRGAAIRSGMSRLIALSLDRKTTLSMEHFQGQIDRSGLKQNGSASSDWTGVKLTRRAGSGTRFALEQLLGDETATTLSAEHEHSWGPWDVDCGLWLGSGKALMSLGNSYRGYHASLSHSLAGDWRLGTGLEGTMLRAELWSLTLEYTPEARMNAALALRRWYSNTTLLEFRGWHRIRRNWQLGAAASSEPTVSLFLKQRF